MKNVKMKVELRKKDLKLIHSHIANILLFTEEHSLMVEPIKDNMVEIRFSLQKQQEKYFFKIIKEEFVSLLLRELVHSKDDSDFNKLKIIDTKITEKEIPELDIDDEFKEFYSRITFNVYYGNIKSFITFDFNYVN